MRRPRGYEALDELDRHDADRRRQRERADRGRRERPTTLPRARSGEHGRPGDPEQERRAGLDGLERHPERERTAAGYAGSVQGERGGSRPRADVPGSEREEARQSDRGQEDDGHAERMRNAERRDNGNRSTEPSGERAGDPARELDTGPRRTKDLERRGNAPCEATTRAHADS